MAGPLNAVIDAQVKAAMATVKFVKDIGFDENGKAVKVDFTFDSVNASTGERTERTLHVPILTMVPVPFIRVRPPVVLDARSPPLFLLQPLCCFASASLRRSKRRLWSSVRRCPA